jgi:hypothetical protein
LNSCKTHPFISNRCNNQHNYCHCSKIYTTVVTGTGTSAVAASAVARLADATVATVTSAAAASAVAMIVTPNVEYAAAVETDTSAATASDLANLAVRASATVGMMLAAGKEAMPAWRVDDTGLDTSAVGAKGHAILLQGLAAVTAPVLASFTAANVMEGRDGAIVASPPCLSFLLGLLHRESRDDGAGTTWASFAAFLQLRWGTVMVGFMIPMNSLK